MASPGSNVLEKDSEKPILKFSDEETVIVLDDEITHLKDNEKPQVTVEIISSSDGSDCEVVSSSFDDNRENVAHANEQHQRGDDENKAAGEENFFIIDKMGGSDTTQTPLYTCNCIGALGDSDVPEPEKDSCPSMECFNCGGDHHLNMCTKEIDRARVARNRREAAKNSSGKTTRYHLGEEQKERFKPGQLSNEMRRALDIGEDELPPFIYRMRVLGYPPGWLMDAVVESSGLKIYGSDGKVMEDDNVEDGEIHSTEKQVQYDPSKLVSFPGYNVPAPLGVIDDYVRYDMPPMQPHQQLSEATKYMKAFAPTPYKKRRKLTLSTPLRKPETAYDVNMDLESVPGTSTNGNGADCGRALGPGPPPNNSEVVQDSLASPSESITEDSASPCAVPAEPGVSSLPNSVLETTWEDSSQISSTTHGNEVSPCKDSVLGQEIEERAHTPDSKNRGGRAHLSQSATLGSPFVRSFSRYNSLPPRENFAKGISEHIPYENLPGATGTYNKLRGVLMRVRRSLNGDQTTDNGDKS